MKTKESIKKLENGSHEISMSFDRETIEKFDELRRRWNLVDAPFEIFLERLIDETMPRLENEFLERFNTTTEIPN